MRARTILIQVAPGGDPLAHGSHVQRLTGAQRAPEGAPAFGKLQARGIRVDPRASPRRNRPGVDTKPAVVDDQALQLRPRTLGAAADAGAFRYV